MGPPSVATSPLSVLSPRTTHQRQGLFPSSALPWLHWQCPQPPRCPPGGSSLYLPHLHLPETWERRFRTEVGKAPPKQAQPIPQSRTWQDPGAGLLTPVPPPAAAQSGQLWYWSPLPQPRQPQVGLGSWTWGAGAITLLGDGQMGSRQSTLTRPPCTSPQTPPASSP